MNQSTPKSASVRKLLGGCNRLISYYRTIGLELLRFERDSRTLGVGLNQDRAVENFRIGTSFITLEALESYLEDLLDSEVTEDRLYLRRGAIRFSPQELAITLLCFALIGATCAWAAGTFPIVSSLIGASVILAAFLVFLPRNRVLRRMRFARVLSQEISRRRGDFGTRTPLRVKQGRNPFAA